MTNVHTPERGTDETVSAYKARRAQSKALVKTMRRGPTQAPKMPGELSEARFWLGQHRNFAKYDRREKLARMGRRQTIKFLKLAKREPTNPAVQGF
jgi:hypothetical protein